ncbi:hypothetical protein C8R46DRAFT_1328443 [Mycena filopes]|nr:hypothetical protein C8R46DRAFT_1328443 [Mycena filopes]
MSILATFTNLAAPASEDLRLHLGVAKQEPLVFSEGFRAASAVLLLFRFRRLLRLLFSLLLVSAFLHPAPAPQPHASPTDAILMGSAGSEKGALHPSCRLRGISGASRAALSSGPAGNFLAPTHGPFTERGSSALLSVPSRATPFGWVTHRPTTTSTDISTPLWPFLPVVVLLSVALLYPVLMSSRLSVRVRVSYRMLISARAKFSSRVSSLSPLRVHFARCTNAAGNKDIPFETIADMGLLDFVARSYVNSVSSSNQTTGSTVPVNYPNTRSSTRANPNLGPGQGSKVPPRNILGTGSQNRTRSRKLRPLDAVQIMFWNIYHNFTLKLPSADFHDVLSEYDIMFFAETDMLPGEDEAADVPPGFTLISLPRKPLLTDTRRGGGVALIIRDTFSFVKSPLSSPDILVLDMGTMWLIGAYIPPESSRWEGWTDVEPLQKLWETVALCSQSPDKHVALLSDLNARTGSRQASTRQVEWDKRWARASADPEDKVNTRGKAVIRECERNDLCILNGTFMESSTAPGRMTSWQHAGESVIDYAVVSRSLLPLVRKFDVALPLEDEDEEWADHMRICLTLDSAAFTQIPRVGRVTQPTPDFSGSGSIDALYQATLDAKQTKDEALESLWGPVLATSIPLQTRNA